MKFRTEVQVASDGLQIEPLERVLLVGPEWETLPHPDHMLLFATTDRLHDYLQEHPVSGATILVKGSNTNRLWTLVDRL